ncbi:MAG: Hsp20/alpha crystallin family protein [Gaiellales bacterium]|nr:Hsp20/alpha crystallin family protein [Gaiellales bacterium]
MAIVRWDPFRELTALQNEVSRLLGRGIGEAGERQSWMPSMDVVESDADIKFKAELPGMKPEDIKIEMDENVLTISGERRFEEKVQEDKYYRIERRYGSFNRSIALPQNVQADQIRANYENGVLEVTVPKMEEAKPKKIEVKVSAQEMGAGAATPPAVEGTATETGSAVA